MWVPCVYHVWPNWIPDGERSKVINFSGAGEVKETCFYDMDELKQKIFDSFTGAHDLRSAHTERLRHQQHQNKCYTGGQNGYATHCMNQKDQNCRLSMFRWR